MGKTFKKVHACSVGDFGSNTKKIPQWITANGGTYYKDVTKDVTHLVTTREAFKQNGPAITEAKKLKTVNIVSYDWLAESLLSKHRRPRLVREYLWTNILKNEKKKTQKRKDTPKKIQREEPVEQTQTDGEETLGSYAGGNPGQKTGGPKAKCTKTRVKSIKKKRNRRSLAKSTDPFDTKLRTPKAQTIAANHRLYEAEGVTYSATLVRPSNTAGNTRETIQLKVFETIKVPHTYATHIKFTRRGLSKTHLLAPLDSNLDTALAAFEGFFKAQTGKGWNDRLDGVLPSPKKDKDGNTQPPHKGWFWFDTGPAESSLASLFHDGKI